MTTRTLPLLGAGYRPSVWCVNCAAPFAAHLSACPDCDYAERPEWLRVLEILVGMWAYNDAVSSDTWDGR